MRTKKWNRFKTSFRACLQIETALRDLKTGPSRTGKFVRQDASL